MLVSAGYDAASAVLELEFRSGEVYAYFHVGPATYASLRDSDSVGRYFHRYIRGKYAYERRPR
jgi:hypothetical protein